MPLDGTSPLVARTYNVSSEYMEDYTRGALNRIMLHGMSRRRPRMLFNWAAIVLLSLRLGFTDTALEQLYEDETWNLLVDWFYSRPPDLSD